MLRLRAALLLALALTLCAALVRAASLDSHLLVDPAGENDGDIFAISVAGVGDVNGDGFDDVLVGANFYPSEAGYGRAYLYFGGPAIDTLADLVFPSPNGDHIGWFGCSVASAGDFNGDGYPDIIIGSRYAGYGKAFIYYGGPSLDTTPDLNLSGEVTPGFGAWFGASVAPAGDVNGDGFPDVIVGAPQYHNASGYLGRAYVYYGGSSPDSIPDRVYTGAATGDQFGYVVGSAGDMNGDGYGDVFATAPNNAGGGTNAGAVYVWYGGPTFHAAPDLVIRGTGPNEMLAKAACAGDINHDGYSDLIVSEADRCEVFFGGPTPDNVPDLVLARRFVSVAGAGDVNGDGVDDFMIGDANDNTNGTGAGRVSVFFGGAAPDTVEDLYFLGDGYGRNLGQCVAAAGNVDGTAPGDLVAGATDDPEHVGYNRGRAYIFSNSLSPTSVPITPPSAGLVFLAPEPNPASGDVHLSLSLDHSVRVRLAAYDAAGHEVARPIADEWLSGRVARTWRPGAALPSGIYYLRATLGERQTVRKLIWLGAR